MNKMYKVYALAQSVGYVLAAFANREDAEAFCDKKGWGLVDEEGNEWYLEIMRDIDEED